MPHFPILIIIGRPASGKSEIIDYLLKAEPASRLHRFHIADPLVLDDFPMLWTWFEEDHLLTTRLGLPALHTDEAGYFKETAYWDLLIERLSLEHQKLLRDDPGNPSSHTTIIEFSRGSEHGGYARALPHLAPELLASAALLCVRVSFAESLRKNRRRFNPNRPDSILEHGLPDEKLTRLYQLDDWDELSSPDPKTLAVGAQRLPYAVFENERDLTSGPPEPLAAELENVLESLWDRYTHRPLP